jgi:hypothetical protein
VVLILYRIVPQKTRIKYNIFDIAFLCFIIVQNKHKCEENYFGCPSGRCILNTWVCDGQKDCEDGLDELHCGEPQACFVLRAVHITTCTLVFPSLEPLSTLLLIDYQNELRP